MDQNTSKKKHILPAAALAIAVLAGAGIYNVAAKVNTAASMTDTVVPEQIGAAASESLSSEIGTGNILGESYIRVTISADGEKIPVYAAAGADVESILDKAGVVIGEDDIVSPLPDEKIEESCTITVQRVSYREDTHIRSYDFKTEYIEDDTVSEDCTRTLTEGECGEVVIKTNTRFVDGKVDEVMVTDKNITKPAVNEVILKGTLKASANPAKGNIISVMPPMHSENGEEIITEEDMFARIADGSEKSDEGVYSPDYASKLTVPEWLELDENGLPEKYSKVLTGRSCAYTAEPDALMSTGKEVFQGYVAVDPNVIPYGTELYIVADDGEVYGYAIAADTGGTVRKGRIIVDLFMNEYDDCIQWGNRAVSVYVLDPDAEDEGAVIEEPVEVSEMTDVPLW